MTDHVNENAELYALGMLDDDDARAVEAHIASCAPCAERVAEAQGVGTSLAAALPAATPSPGLERRLSNAVRPAERTSTRPIRLGRYAIAAALAIAMLGLAWQTIALRGRLESQDLALATIVHSHFDHLSMTPDPANPVAAKVLYARDGSWIYVIADQPGGTIHVMATLEAGTTDLGAMAPSGQTATLFARPLERVRKIVLQRNGATVASAVLKY